MAGFLRKTGALFIGNRMQDAIVPTEDPLTRSQGPFDTALREGLVNAPHLPGPGVAIVVRYFQHRQCMYIRFL